MELHVVREIAAPQGRVWDTITDLATAPVTLSGVTRVERLDAGDAFGVGTRWRETRRMFGRSPHRGAGQRGRVPSVTRLRWARASPTGLRSTRWMSRASRAAAP